MRLCPPDDDAPSSKAGEPNINHNRWILLMIATILTIKGTLYGRTRLVLDGGN
jgi:hypothetical protein